jgi:O-methyltransferase domain/Dimerisation domain
MVEKTMQNATLDAAGVADLITGSWRSQILYAGVELGVFERLSEQSPSSSDWVARALSVDASFLYRLLRGLGSIGLLHEDTDRNFKLTPAGALLTAAHPRSMRGIARLEGGVQHYLSWRHLPDIIRTGRANGFVREFGVDFFTYQSCDAAYADAFHAAMSSYTAAETEVVSGLIRDPHPGDVGIFCDVGGGHGHLLGQILQDFPKASGIVFDLPAVTAAQAASVKSPDVLQSRCQYVGGDMFTEVPRADIYFLKHILHDWRDDECRQILRTVRKSAKPDSRLFICEWFIPKPDLAHFAKLVDVHMLCVSSGRQRTVEEFSLMLGRSGWSVTRLRESNVPLGVLEARAV